MREIFVTLGLVILSLFKELRLIREGFPLKFEVPRLLRIGNVEAVSCITVGEVLIKESKVEGCYIFNINKKDSYRLFAIEKSIVLCETELRTFNIK